MNGKKEKKKRLGEFKLKMKISKLVSLVLIAVGAGCLITLISTGAGAVFFCLGALVFFIEAFPHFERLYRWIGCRIMTFREKMEEELEE